MKFKLNLLPTLLVCSTACWAQNNGTQSTPEANNDKTHKVEIKGDTDVEKNSDFAAGKLIIEKKEIGDSGLQNVGELLKRHPAITVGKDGRISLLGMPGYTQVLVNGQPPSGRNPNDMDLSEIERIEIIKTATAETGPFGIAGTINIISKKTERKRTQQVIGGTQYQAGALGFNGNWSMNEGDMTGPLQWRLAVGANQNNTETDFVFTETHYDRNGGKLSDYSGQIQKKNLNAFNSLSSEVNYRLDEKNSLSFSPGFGNFNSRSEARERREYRSQGGGHILNFERNEVYGLDFPLEWSREVSEEANFTLLLKLSVERMNVENQSANDLVGASGVDSRSRRDNESVNHLLDFKFQQSLEGGHELKTGFKWSANSDHGRRWNTLNGLSDPNFDRYGDTSGYRMRELRIFIQDEWKIDKLTAIHAGLSGANRRETLEEGPYVTHSNFQIWSPSFNIARKLSGEHKPRIRFSVARSFQAPIDIDMLMARPMINSLAPCLRVYQCTPNTPDTADSVGNPQLKPERALAVSLSYEHNLSANSQLSYEIYTRQFADKFGREISLMPVAWSNSPRYVSRPANLGEAQAIGASVGGTLALQDFVKTAPKINFRGNITLARSTISNLPRPFNHIEGHANWRAKLGLTYDVSDMPVKINLDANWAPSDWIRNNDLRKTYTSRMASYSGSVAWSPSKTLKLVMSVNHVFAPSRESISEYQTEGGILRRSTKNETPVRVGIRIEKKL